MPWCKYWDCELESWDECESCIMLTQETAHVTGTKDDWCLVRFCDALEMGDIRPMETYDSRRDEWRI